MEMNEIKRILQEQGEAFEAFKKANDEALKAKAEGKATADLLVAVENANKRISELSDEKAKAEAEYEAKFADLAKRTRPGVEGKTDEDLTAEVKMFNAHNQAMSPSKVVKALDQDQYLAYKSGFLSIMRGGSVDQLEDHERKAMMVGVDSQGGYVVPPAVVSRIITRSMTSR